MTTDISLKNYLTIQRVEITKVIRYRIARTLNELEKLARLLETESHDILIEYADQAHVTAASIKEALFQRQMIEDVEDYIDQEPTVI